MRGPAGLIAGLLIALCAAAHAADVVLVNGRIVTPNGAAEALAVTGDRIEAVGTTAEIRARAGATAKVIELGGRTVIPGLIDSHMHAIRAGLTFATEVSWIGTRSIPEALTRIAAAARTTPPEAWIVVAGGWTDRQFAELRRPTSAEIMAAAPGRAVYVQLFYRAALLSPEGYRRLGIAGDADVPPKGRIEPDGWIAGDTATLVALFDRLPRPSLEQAKEGTLRFFAELNRLGITGVLDPGGLNLRREDYAALLALEREDALTVRVAFSLFLPGGASALEETKELARRWQSAPRTKSGLLIFNGIGERITFGMYNNDSPSEAEKDEYFGVARWAAQEGLTLTQHWPNDASVHHLLDVFERVDREVKIAPLRWSIAHIHDATPETLARMKALGVGWLMQDGLRFAAPSYLNARSRETLARIPPIVTALRRGVAIGGGTDAHRVMDYNPFVSLAWMLDGLTVDGTPTRGPDEIPSRREALEIYTKGSAWFSFDEGRRGTLEPGKLADLGVLSQDVLTVPLRDLPRTESLLTMVGGRIVHASGSFATHASLSTRP